MILIFSGSSFAQSERDRAKGKKGRKGGSREPGGYVEGGIAGIDFMKKFDFDKDGKVDNKEFTGQHFPVYDKNSDGFIEAHEAPQGETAY